MIYKGFPADEETAVECHQSLLSLLTDRARKIKPEIHHAYSTYKVTFHIKQYLNCTVSSLFNFIAKCQQYMQSLVHFS